jgi:hypothetical protein
MKSNFRTVKNWFPVRMRRAAAPWPVTAGRTTGLLMLRGVPAAVVLILLAAVACSSSGTQATTSKTDVPASSSHTNSGEVGRSGKEVPKNDIIAGLITFSGQFAMSGAHEASISFEAFPGITSPKSSCARIGALGTPVSKGQKGQFVIPAPPQGSDATLAAKVQPYHGPGAYQKSSIVAIPGSLVMGNDTYDLLASGATVSVSLSADGSGKLTFTNAAAVGAAKPALSGTIQWTCKN